MNNDVNRYFFKKQVKLKAFKVVKYPSKEREH